MTAEPSRRQISWPAVAALSWGAAAATAAVALLMLLRLINPNVETVTIPLGLIFGLGLAAAIGAVCGYLVLWLTRLIQSATAKARPATRVTLVIAVNASVVAAALYWAANPSRDSMSFTMVICGLTGLVSGALAARYGQQ